MLRWKKNYARAHRSQNADSNDHEEIEMLDSAFRANEIFIIVIINAVGNFNTLQLEVKHTDTHVLPLGGQKQLTNGRSNNIRKTQWTTQWAIKSVRNNSS